MTTSMPLPSAPPSTFVQGPRETGPGGAVEAGAASLPWAPGLLALLLLSGCTCGPRVMDVDPEALRVMPTSITFEDTFVGASRIAVVTVSNPSRVSEQRTVTVDAPFSLVSPTDTFVAGATELQLVFTPTEPGLASGTLRIGELEVPLNGTGLAPLTCTSDNPCETTHFDTTLGNCVTTKRPDDETCETRCVRGMCTNGTCAGTAVSCPQTTCTVGVCSEADGCGQVARECVQPSNPCQRARCDETLGCFTEEAEDGTVCGTDDCRLTTVEVCIVGQCVVRPRATSGQCAHTWLPLSFGSRFHPALGHDVTSRRMIAFGGGGAYGLSDDTWSWDGAQWTLLSPPNAPSARGSTSLVSEGGLRRVALLFGGSGPSSVLGDTWEWDGRTWLQRSPATSPPARADHALSWDSNRRRAVLFGGRTNNARLADTWEWDGHTWLQRTPAQSPSARLSAAIAYDPVRQVTVLFGGNVAGAGGGDQHVSDTWEYDGATWTQRATLTLSGTRTTRTMAWDPVTRSTLLVTSNNTTRETWRYDGAWHAVPSTPGGRSYGVLSLDTDRRRLVFVAGVETWEWDGVSFTLRHASTALDKALSLVTDLSPAAPLLIDAQSVPWHWLDGGWSAGPAFNPSPVGRTEMVGDWDPVRRRFVLFGGFGTGPSLWERGDGGWSAPSASGSSPGENCSRAAGAYDVSRGAFVVAGCEALNDDGGRSSYEWNGSTWTEHAGPPRALKAMAWDPTHQHLVAVGNGATFTRTAGQWEARPDAGLSLPNAAYGLTVDKARGVVVLVGEPTNLNPVTWEWNGESWSRPSLARQPPPTYWYTGNTVVYEPAEQRVLVWDGASFWQYVP